MNNGDDIHNLLRTLGHDAGLYQDLAQYNASRAAVRRAAMARPTEPVVAAAAAAAVSTTQPIQAPVPAPPHASGLPRVLRVGQDPHGTPASLSSILHRLASPHGPGPAHGLDHGSAAAPALPDQSTSPPTRLDRLFGRLASRSPGPLSR